MDNVNYTEKLQNLKDRLTVLYSDATIEQTIDQNGNSIWKTTIPGLKVIESMNVNAIETVVENLEDARRREERGN